MYPLHTNISAGSSSSSNSSSSSCGDSRW